jgi:SAM-dependent methyltransferase
MTPHGSAATKSETAALVEKWLSCPIGHGKLTVTGGRITSGEPSFQGEIVDNVAVMAGAIQKSFFDDKFETMQRGHERKGEWDFCYAQQTALLESYLRPGQLILDVGCGPSLPYSRPKGAVVVGLEPSFASIRANRDVDLRVNGTAAAIPLPDSSVDVIVCFYSIHHMVGKTLQETRGNVGQAFREFGRVLRPEGVLFVFEMTPIAPFQGVQALLWNAVRSAAPGMLDMYFWSARSLLALARSMLPPGAAPEKVIFGTSPFSAIPPVFNLPWFKIPRAAYPLDARPYKWRLAPRPS